jgi:peptide/nickel transport system permease protein
MVGFVIILESSASFLGVGSADIRTWGQMLQYVFATGAVRHAWWWTLPPGACIALLVMSVFFLSKGIENITNPELEGR